MFTITNDALSPFWSRLVDFIPDFFGGLIIIVIGLILSGVLKKILLTIFRFFRIDEILEKTKLMVRTEVKMWEDRKSVV